MVQENYSRRNWSDEIYRDPIVQHFIINTKTKLKKENRKWKIENGNSKPKHFLYLFIFKLLLTNFIPHRFF
jgi:hypothetical protein